MTGYILTLSNGDTLTTVSVKTVDDQANTSIVLIGQGIPDYGQYVAQDLVWMLENFADATPPVNPLVGQEWYDNSKSRMNVYDGVDWRSMLSDKTGNGRFDMLSTATNVDMTLVASVPIFTGIAGRTYVPTSLVMVTTGAYTATGGPTLNVSVSSSGDIIPASTLTVSGSGVAQILRAARPREISGATTVNLNVTSVATGGQMNFNVYLFGFTI